MPSREGGVDQSTLPESYAADVRAVQEIAVVPTILDVVCQMTGLRFAAVARVTDERWVACAVRDEIAFGLSPGGELVLDTTICHEIHQHGAPVVIDDAQCDPEYREHRTPRQYGFRSYISVPIRLGDGSMFGTLCAIDPLPARVSDDKVVKAFQLFADLIAQHLQSREDLRVTQSALRLSEQRAELQQQFVAILSHDLRNPLSAVLMAARMLLQMELPSRARNMAAVIDRSTVRMTGLIDNVLDFARVRLGGGLAMERRPEANLAGTIEHVISELRTAHPERQIESRVTLSGSVSCDPSRIGQLLSNLLFNALAHGDPSGPVRVHADDRQGFVLSVANTGKPIAPATLERLFLPFERGEVRSAGEGLGLGLFIASEIARGHGGTLEASSTDAWTTFTLRIPPGGTSPSSSTHA